VRFELPNLGVVSATVSLSGEHAQIRIGTPSEPVSDLLRASGASLAGALEAAGTRLDALLVKRDEQA
jgi:hypothetical protein